MATQAEKDRLLADVGADANTFTDAELEDIFAVAATENAGRSDAVVYSAARVIAVRRLIAAIVPTIGRYTAGESSEDRSQVLRGLQALLSIYEDAYDKDVRADLQSGASGGIVFGRLTRAKPKREREWPNA